MGKKKALEVFQKENDLNQKKQRFMKTLRGGLVNMGEAAFQRLGVITSKSFKTPLPVPLVT